MQHLTCAIQEIRAHHERSERTDDYKRSITHTISDRYAPVCPHKTFPDPLSMIKALFRRNAGHLQFRGKLLNRNEIFVQYIRLKKPECEDYQRHPLICLPSSLHIILHVAEEHWISDFANLIGTFVHAQLLPISPNSNLVNALPNAKILQRAEIKVTSDEEIINLEDLEELEGFKLYWVSKEEADSRSHPIIKKARKDIIDSVPKSVYSFVESSLDALRCTKLEMQELHIPSMTTFAPFTQLLQANRPFSYQSLNLRQVFDTNSPVFFLIYFSTTEKQMVDGPAQARKEVGYKRRQFW